MGCCQLQTKVCAHSTGLPHKFDQKIYVSPLFGFNLATVCSSVVDSLVVVAPIVFGFFCDVASSVLSGAKLGDWIASFNCCHFYRITFI